MLCKYCNRTAKTLVSNSQHELYCKSNPNRKSKTPSYGMLGKTKALGWDNKNQWSIPNYKISEETRKKQSAASKKQVWSEEQKKRQSVRMKEAVRNNPESYTSSNRGRTKQIEFDGVKFQGSWELEFYKWAKAANLNPERCIEGFGYVWNGNRTYFPDFYIREYDLYIEVKGYKTERDDAKWNQFPKKLLVVDKKGIDSIKKGCYTISK